MSEWIGNCTWSYYYLIIIESVWIWNYILLLIDVPFICCLIQPTIGLSILTIFAKEKLSILLLMSFVVASIFINFNVASNSLLISFLLAVFLVSWVGCLAIYFSLISYSGHPLLLSASDISSSSSRNEECSYPTLSPLGGTDLDHQL